MDAQQSLFPFGPQLAAIPLQLGRGSHRCVERLQLGVAPLQSALPTQATQADAAVLTRLHLGVLPVQAVQLGPQLVSALQVAQAPALQVWLLAHAVSVDAYVQTPPLHVPEAA